MEIKTIFFNQLGLRTSTHYTVGEEGVVNISSHCFRTGSLRGTGYYDVLFADDSVLRLHEVKAVLFVPETLKEEN